MKQIRRAVPILCTLLLLGLGLYMPHLVSLSLNLHLQSEIRQMENSDISLNLSQDTDVLQSLFLFNSLSSGGDSAIELSESSQGYRLGAEEVKAVAVEVLKQLKTDITAYDEPEMTPILFVGTNDSFIRSRVFWQCLWVSGSGETETIWVDDLNEQVVGFILNDPMSPLSVDDSKDNAAYSTDYSKEHIPEIVYHLEEFCRRYYPVEEVILQNEGKNMFTLILTQIQNGLENSYPVFVSWENGRLFFNC